MKKLYLLLLIVTISKNIYAQNNVLFRTDRVDDLRDVAARQRFDLAPGHLRRVADDAALAAAERDVRHGALPRHPGGQRRHFVERDAGVIADAALRRPERDVVLNAVAGEDFDLAVVHLDRTGDRDLSLRVGEDFPDAGLEVEDARRSVELLEHRVENRSVRNRHGAPSRYSSKRASLTWPESTSQASRL